MHKQAQSSLYELLLRIMPELRDMGTLGLPRGAKARPEAANLLYSLWNNASPKESSRKIRVPSGVSPKELSSLESEGLVEASGDSVEITKKGGEVLKQMILGDDRSALESDGKPVDYLKALASLQPGRRQQKYGHKTASADVMSSVGTNWYLDALRASRP